MTCSLLRIIFNNLADNASMSFSSGSVSTLPISNLTNVMRSRVARTTSKDNVDILGSWPNNQHINSLVLYRHTLSKSATIRLQLYDSENQTGNIIYDSATISAIPSLNLGEIQFGIGDLVQSVFDNWPLAFSAHYFPIVIARSFRITISDPSNQNSYIDIQRLFLGRYIEPSVNFSYGHSHLWKDESTQIRTDGGSLYTETGTQYREFKMQLNWLSESDRPLFFEAIRDIGKRKDFFVSLYPESGGQKERDFSIAAKFKNSQTITNSFHQNYKLPLVIEEV